MHADETCLPRSLPFTPAPFVFFQEKSCCHPGLRLRRSNLLTTPMRNVAGQAKALFPVSKGFERWEHRFIQSKKTLTYFPAFLIQKTPCKCVCIKKHCMYPLTGWYALYGFWMNALSTYEVILMLLSPFMQDYVKLKPESRRSIILKRIAARYFRSPGKPIGAWLWMCISTSILFPNLLLSWMSSQENLFSG